MFMHLLPFSQVVFYVTEMFLLYIYYLIWNFCEVSLVLMVGLFPLRRLRSSIAGASGGDSGTGGVHGTSACRGEVGRGSSGRVRVSSAPSLKRSRRRPGRRQQPQLVRRHLHGLGPGRGFLAVAGRRHAKPLAVRGGGGRSVVWSVLTWQVRTLAREKTINTNKLLSVSQAIPWQCLVLKVCFHLPLGFPLPSLCSCSLPLTD